jgi:lysozyme family protein
MDNEHGNLKLTWPGDSANPAFTIRVINSCAKYRAEGDRGDCGLPRGVCMEEGTMATFDIFLPMLLKFEGGFVDDPDDPGGETNKGVTMATFQSSSHELLGIDPTSDNLKALTDAQAGIIYKALYWNKIQGDAITLQDLANIVCDFFVNSGSHATKLLQSVMIDMGANISADGVIGPGSIQALNGLPQVEVYRRYKQARIAFYQNLGQKFPKFLKGWLNRVNSFPDL